jgi:hypothetical protein
MGQDISVVANPYLYFGSDRTAGREHNLQPIEDEPDQDTVLKQQDK